MVLITSLGLAWLFTLSRAAKLAPAFDFTSITGQRIELTQPPGHPVLVTFWATDCPACVAEIPHFIDLYRRYHCAGLEIIAIAMMYDPPNHVVEMNKAKNIPYPIALDLTGEYALAFGGVNLTPNTFFIAPDGNIAQHFTGSFEVKKVESRLSTYLQDRTCSG